MVKKSGRRLRASVGQGGLRVPIRLEMSSKLGESVGEAEGLDRGDAGVSSVAVFHGGRGLPRMCHERHAGGGERDGGGRGHPKGDRGVDRDHPGPEEADLIFSNFSIASLDADRDYLYVDVGGGSTELTLIREGQRIEAKSFRIGSVRLLKGKVQPGVREGMAERCRDLIQEYGVARPIVIGSGGNINRLYTLAGGVGKKPISREDLERTHAQLEQATHAEKLNRFGLKPDRADVIVPACRIYLDAMDLFGADTVIVPKVGLGDGMVLELHRQRTG